MMLQIKYLAAKICGLCLSISLLQACNGEHPTASHSFAVYSVGDFKYNFVVSGNKFLIGYGVEEKNPRYYVEKYGAVINKVKTRDGICFNFGTDFSVGKSRNGIQTCNGWRLEQRYSNKNISYYLGFCSTKARGCPDAFSNKPMVEYELNERSELLSFKFDPTASDSKPYIFKLGKPLVLLDK